jgi:hypothetical protein
MQSFKETIQGRRNPESNGHKSGGRLKRQGLAKEIPYIQDAGNLCAPGEAKKPWAGTAAHREKGRKP